MVTNSLRLDGTRWNEVKDLTRIQNQNGIKCNRMGQDRTVVLQLQIRYASYSANEWLDPMKEAPSNEGAFLFQRHPHREGQGVGTGDGGGVVSGGDPSVWNSACSEQIYTLDYLLYYRGNVI